jgi:DNA-binding PadR family transcriptional regulator
MYRDNSLIPIEAVRLSALGRLLRGPMRYAALAGEVRHFTSRMVGPSLELLGTSIELLRLEGLVEAVEGKSMEDDALLAITEAGRAAFRELMRANVRAPGSDMGKLVLALKLKFLDLLEPADRREVVEGMIEIHRGEKARLADLRRGLSGGSDDPLLRWLDLEIAQVDQRLEWCERFQATQ